MSIMRTLTLMDTWFFQCTPRWHASVEDAVSRKTCCQLLFGFHLGDLGALGQHVGDDRSLEVSHPFGRLAELIARDTMVALATTR